MHSGRFFRKYVESSHWEGWEKWGENSSLSRNDKVLYITKLINYFMLSRYNVHSPFYNSLVIVELSASRVVCCSCLLLLKCQMLALCLPYSTGKLRVISWFLCIFVHRTVRQQTFISLNWSKTKRRINRRNWFRNPISVLQYSRILNGKMLWWGSWYFGAQLRKHGKGWTLLPCTSELMLIFARVWCFPGSPQSYWQAEKGLFAKCFMNFRWWLLLLCKHEAPWIQPMACWP